MSSYVQSEIDRLQTYRRTRLAMGQTAWADELLLRLTELQARRAEEIIQEAKAWEHYLAASAKVFPQRQIPTGPVDEEAAFRCGTCGKLLGTYEHGYCAGCRAEDQDFQ